MVWYITAGSYLLGLFKEWLFTIFIVPFKTSDMLWLLVPVWLSWFFAEFFQEKRGTSSGNAISNAVVVLWGGIDCMRQTVNLIVHKAISGFGTIFIRLFVALMILSYGVSVIVLGIKGSPLIKKIARVRVVTYVFAMTVPIFYNALPLTVNHFIASIIYFPLFYYVIELIDRLVPDPKAMEEDRRAI